MHGQKNIKLLLLRCQRQSCPFARYEGVFKSGGIPPLILNPVLGWSVFTFTPLPIYPSGMVQHNSFTGRFGGLQAGLGVL